MAAAGRAFARAGVAAVYCVHGTFTGNDALGLFTELARYAPGVAESFRKLTKRAFDAVLGETGNYTPQFAARMEAGLSAGAERLIPVRLFNWAGQNHHISRADAAVRLIDELARAANGFANDPPPSKGGARGGISDVANPFPSRPRVLLWAHSHGGNALAIVTNLLGADALTRTEFFAAASVFHRTSHSMRTQFPVWQRVEELLADPHHPLRQLQLNIVTFGTPVRYGWDSGGYGKLLHIVQHRPTLGGPEYLAHYPPRWRSVLAGRGGDFMQQIGIAGTNFAPLPIAWRTFLADRRLGRLLQRELPREWLHTRLKRGMRVPEEGTTLLVEYDDPDRVPFRHLLGHAPYTRSRWLAFHCELIAEQFYDENRDAV